ncbi:alpha/beta fold hydrolase [Gorillibacterium sp. sgz500922]|uniref:alpha/beta fold hydrolase n=1 Tax=Gorillibacterium sp. sgz500922 TaxID=3446694 RepID=UPI003F66783A
MTTESTRCRLHAVRSGSGKPVLCLHGNRDSSEVFRELGVALGGSRKVLRADLRGHGASRYEGGPFTIDDMADDVLGLLEEEGIERTAVIGHSLGSSLAMLLASRYPERFERLVLIGAAATFRPSFRRPAEGERIDAETVERTNQAAAPYFFTERHPEVRDRVLAGWRALPAAMHERMIGVRHPDLLPLLAGIRVPALVLCGGADRITPPEKSQELADGLPDARLEVVEGAGHFVFLEEPDETARRIRAFLEESGS